MASKKEVAKEAEVDLKYDLKVLWGFLSKYKLFFWGMIFLAFIREAGAMADNFIFKYLVDKAELFTQDAITAEIFAKVILLSVLVFIALKIITSVLWYISIKFSVKLDSKLMKDIEKKTFSHIINLSYRFHLGKKTGSIISKFTRGVNKVESLVDAFMYNFVAVMFRIILSIGVIFVFDMVTSLILLITTAAVIFTGVIITNMQKQPQSMANYREDNLKQNLSDVFLNIDTVKYFAKEEKTYRYFGNLSETLRKTREKFWNFFCWHASIQTLILGLGVSAMIYFSFTGFLKGNLTLGTITLIYASIWKLIPQLFGLIHGYREFVRSIVDVDALFKIFKEKNEVKDITNAKKLLVKDGNIRFKNVFFSYPRFKNVREDRTALLKNFDLDIKKNSKVALVGPSGGGKSTVVRLLYRLFDLDSGYISIDGQDIATVTQKSLRSSMSVVPQEPILFDNSIYFNVAYANPKASKKEVWQAIKFAKLDKLINSLPNKEKTVVGERGVKLSGGEKQRVSIARAILANKKILVLDEATSSLDSETEREIQGYLEQLMKGRTTIIIAHRLSTVMKADAIVVIDEGKIVEQGTHAELANKKGGLYRKLWELQQGCRLD
ncbi:MAG: ABC transporter ATP-binding protein [archaeon]|nr:ABC transporter ATP-binding protein/permease [Nanoarchaeota archaeon]